MKQGISKDIFIIIIRKNLMKSSTSKITSFELEAWLKG
jgi:hypothetical protein